jgi:F0F1-type ATP synthase assembly protein I
MTIKDKKIVSGNTGPRPKLNTASALAVYSQLGISMSASVVIGIMGGIFLDRRLGTSPLFLFFGCIVGTGASFKVLYDLTIKKITAARRNPAGVKRAGGGRADAGRAGGGHAGGGRIESGRAGGGPDTCDKRNEDKNE